MSDLLTITVDGKQIECAPGTTVLNAALENGIEIPNLCYLKELSPYGACGVCVVEVEGMPKLMRACSLNVKDGMVVHTDTVRVQKTRKLALELLMGDHYGDCVAPCSLKCPANTNVQKYIKQIADGDFPGAVETVKEKIPLPASIGRVCPHPCEKACSRKTADEPISIAYLKAFAADEVMKNGNEKPSLKKADTGKTVGIVGGGPAGLTAAYFLSLKGHQVTVYEQMPKMGGMLRYGIPEYRLPKAVLDKEIEQIKALGVTFVNGFTVGKDESLEALKNKHDAVLLCYGAWKSSSIRCKGENLEGVWGGIDLLREIALGNKPEIGNKTAVVGGGNTAMDACRSAVRLGAKEVSIIYRRTLEEMPAERVEIEEAMEEGVIFRFLTNPDEILGENGKVTGVRLQKMKLGEPDERGRRAPVPIEGEFITLDLDSVIIAAGQTNNNNGFEGLTFTKKGTVEADEISFATALPGIFAAGDVTNKGASIAIEAIAEAGKAANAIDAYLNGQNVSFRKPVLSVRQDRTEQVKDVAKAPRIKMPQRPAEERKHDFKEINLGLTAQTAMTEAKRCLSCGCFDYGECKLIKYADLVGADVTRFTGAFHTGYLETKLVTIERDQHKCILCGACVRACEQIAKKGLLGLVGRGFSTVIKPEYRDSLVTKGCKDCNLCVKACPTGALRVIK